MIFHPLTPTLLIDYKSPLVPAIFRTEPSSWLKSRSPYYRSSWRESVFYHFNYCPAQEWQERKLQESAPLTQAMPPMFQYGGWDPKCRPWISSLISSSHSHLSTNWNRMSILQHVSQKYQFIFRREESGLWPSWYMIPKAKTLPYHETLGKGPSFNS